MLGEIIGLYAYRFAFVRLCCAAINPQCIAKTAKNATKHRLRGTPRYNKEVYQFWGRPLQLGNITTVPVRFDKAQREAKLREEERAPSARSLSMCDGAAQRSEASL
jgi:hypothetical protein